MNKATIDPTNVRRAITEYKKANPATARAIANYKKLKASHTFAKNGSGNYRTSTTTQLSSVFTTR